MLIANRRNELIRVMHIMCVYVYECEFVIFRAMTWIVIQKFIEWNKCYSLVWLPISKVNLNEHKKNIYVFQFLISILVFFFYYLKKISFSHVVFLSDYLNRDEIRLLKIVTWKMHVYDRHRFSCCFFMKLSILKQILNSQWQTITFCSACYCSQTHYI